MPDWRTMFDYDWIKAWDLGGQERTVTITKVEPGLVEDRKAKVERGKPAKMDRLAIVWLKGWKKPLGLNKTNAAAIGKMYTNKTESWIGKRFTMYPTTTMAWGSESDCIRIKPGVPEEKGEPAPDISNLPAATNGRPDESGVEG